MYPCGYYFPSLVEFGPHRYLLACGADIGAAEFAIQSNGESPEMNVMLNMSFWELRACSSCSSP